MAADPRPRAPPASPTRSLVPLLLVLLAAAGPAEAQQQRLRIRNACSREPLWIAHEAGAGIGPDAQNVKIEAEGSFDFLTPPGLSATRYWPKMGCDASGGNCSLGGSGGPGEACVRRPPEVPEDDYSRCAPPVDTKFEGTFGDPALPCDDRVGVTGCDYVDMSLVDGWTLPFQLKITGNCTSAKGLTESLDIDCSRLSFDLCPAQEQLTAAGLAADLRAVNPRTGQVAGCYAPCQKLVSPNWNNSLSTGRRPQDGEVAPYCCPTPPETPEACRSGPINSTSFLKAVHGKCPGVYGYAYDDGMGLLRCSPAAIYELTFFCPGAPTTPKPGWVVPGTQRKGTAAAAPGQEQTTTGSAAGLLLRPTATATDPTNTDQTLLHKPGKDPELALSKKQWDDDRLFEAKDNAAIPHLGGSEPLLLQPAVAGRAAVVRKDARFIALSLVTLAGFMAAGSAALVFLRQPKCAASARETGAEEAPLASDRSSQPSQSDGPQSELLTLL